MLRTPATDGFLEAAFKNAYDHSLTAAIRRVYELGVTDAEWQALVDEQPAAGASLPENLVVTHEAPVDVYMTAPTIDGPSGPDAPFVPTSATPE